MPVSVADSNTQTLTTTTLTTLVTQVAPTGGAIYKARVRLNNVIAGETGRVIVQVMPVTAGTYEEAYRHEFANVAGSPILEMPAVDLPAAAGVKVLIQQDHTTSRAYDWWLNRLDG